MSGSVVGVCGEVGPAHKITWNKIYLHLCCALVLVEVCPSDLGPGNAAHREEGQGGTGRIPALTQTAAREGS